MHFDHFLSSLIRDCSQTTLTRFWLFLTTYDIFYAINFEKKWNFWTTYLHTLSCKCCLQMNPKYFRREIQTFPDPNTSVKRHVYEFEECSTSDDFNPLSVHSRCSLCSLLCNWAERCVSSVKWWRDIEKCYCTIVAKTTHLRHQKGRLTTIILQPYIFVRASVNGLLSTRKDPF